MSRRRGVEDHVVVVGGDLRVAKELRELVEGCNLDRASAGELFLDAVHGSFRQQISIWSNNSFAILFRGLLGIDVHSKQTRYGLDCRWMYTERGRQNFVQIGSRVCADQEYAFAFIGESNRSCASDRCFPDATLAREEQVARKRPRQLHFVTPALPMPTRSLARTFTFGPGSYGIDVKVASCSRVG